MTSEPPPGQDDGRSGGFLLNVNLVFAGTLIDYAFTFLAGVLLARALGSEGRGVVAIFQASVGLAYAFLSLGVATAVVYFVARRDLKSREAMEVGLAVTLAATLVGAGVIGLGGLALGRFSEAGAPFWLALVALPGALQFRLLEGVLRAQGRFGAMNILVVSLPAVSLAALAGVALLWRLDVTSAVQAWSLSFLPPVLLGYALVGPSAWPRALPGLGRLRRVLFFGAQGQLGNLIQLLNYRLDSFLVLLFVNASGVGLYAVGVSLSEGLWFVANSVAVVLLTDLTAADAARAARMTALVCRNTLLVTALAAVAAALAAPLLVPAVFGGEFRGSVLPFVLLLPGTAAQAAVKVLAAYVFSRGRPMINANIALATLVVTVLLDLLLIPLLGVPGAALASSLAYGASLYLTGVAFRRLSGYSLAEALLPQRSDVGIYLDAARSLARRLTMARRPARPGLRG